MYRTIDDANSDATCAETSTIRSANKAVSHCTLSASRRSECTRLRVSAPTSAMTGKRFVVLAYSQFYSIPSSFHVYFQTKI